MITEIKRNKVFKLLGVKPTNERWSWCALSPDHKRAVFTLWEDLLGKGESVLQWDNYHIKNRLGALDQNRILELVMKENIPAYGLICIAKDPNATPRSILRTKADFLIRLKIQKNGGKVFGRHLESVHMLEVAREIRESKSVERDGLNDLEDIPPGSVTPDRALSTGWVVVRDAKVRSYVLRQAAGKCEYCGKEGFLMKSGQRYLEAHHIISLSNQGRDTVDNVIALCPEHHREAHYGEDAEALEGKFIASMRNR